MLQPIHDTNPSECLCEECEDHRHYLYHMSKSKTIKQVEQEIIERASKRAKKDESSSEEEHKPRIADLIKSPVKSDLARYLFLKRKITELQKELRELQSGVRTEEAEREHANGETQ